MVPKISPFVINLPKPSLSVGFKSNPKRIGTCFDTVKYNALSLSFISGRFTISNSEVHPSIFMLDISRLQLLGEKRIKKVKEWP